MSSSDSISVVQLSSQLIEPPHISSPGLSVPASQPVHVPLLLENGDGKQSQHLC